MDTKNRLKKLLKSEHFRKTYNCTDFGTIIKQIFVPIPVYRKRKGIDSCDKEEILTGPGVIKLVSQYMGPEHVAFVEKACEYTRLLHMTDSLENQANPTLFILSKSQVY